MNSLEVPRPNVARLGQWLQSWVQPSGAINGFHNHPIWGSNPYRTLDFTCGHSTFAAPLMMALTDQLRKSPDDRARELLCRLVRFQTGAIAEDGQYKHIGFQVGEKCAVGLIHNAVPNLALAYVALHGREFLDSGQWDAIGQRVRNGLEVLDQRYPNDPAASRTCNQEYARTWARLLYGQAFGDPRWYDRACAELLQAIADFHRRGWPDAECAATLRSNTDQRQSFEPAEYYGLMIEPLILGYQIYGRQTFLDEAIALANHVVRSAWIDAAGQTRLHRHWIKINNGYIKINEPMCIAGGGLTASSIASLHAIQPNESFRAFLESIIRTYAHYQHPAGFFLSATGWQSELDVAPSSAWHSHDFLFLARQLTPDRAFWDEVFSENPRTSILLGDQCFYVEQGKHWAVADYLTSDAFRLRGRKDRDRFYVEPYPWVPGDEPMPDDMRFLNLPQYWKTDENFVLARPGDANTDAVTFTKRPVMLAK